MALRMLFLMNGSSRGFDSKEKYDAMVRGLQKSSVEVHPVVLTYESKDANHTLLLQAVSQIKPHWIHSLLWWPNLLDTEVFLSLKSPKIKLTSWASEWIGNRPEEKTKDLMQVATGCDLVYVANRTYMKELQTQGLTTYWLPWAYDADSLYIKTPPTHRDKLVFMGVNYGAILPEGPFRSQLMKRLCQDYPNFWVYGYPWKSEDGYRCGGVIRGSEVNDIYNQAILGVEVNIERTHHSERMYMSLGAGCIHLTRRFSECELLFDGAMELYNPFFETKDECLGLVDQILSMKHDAQEELSKNLALWVSKTHSYTQFAETMLEGFKQL